MTQVLIIESESSFAQQLDDGLRAESCDVTVIADGKDAIQYAAGAPPDLIIVTAELPKMNGFTVCNRLRKEPGLKDTPIVLLSADASEETFSQHSKMEGKRANAYLHKPIRYEDLAPTLGQFIPLGAVSRSSRGPVSSGLPPSLFPSPDALIAEVDGASLAQSEPEHSSALNLAAQAALEEITSAEDVEELDLRELEELPAVHAPKPFSSDRPPASARPLALGVLTDKTEVSGGSGAAVSSNDDGKVAELTAALERSEQAHQSQIEQVTRDFEEQRLAHQNDLETLSGEMSQRRMEHDTQLAELQRELEHARQLLGDAESKDDGTQAQASLASLQEEHAAQVARHTQVLDALRAENAATVSRLEAEQAAALHTLTVEQHKRAQSKEREHEEAQKHAREAHAAELGQAQQAHAAALDQAQQTHAAALDQAQQAHAAELGRLRQVHKEELEQERQAHRAAYAELTERLAATENAAAGERERLQVEVDDARRQAAETAASASQSLEQARQANESLAQEQAALANKLNTAKEALDTVEEQLAHSQTQLSSLQELRDHDRAALRDMKGHLQATLDQVEGVFRRELPPA